MEGVGVVLFEELVVVVMLVWLVVPVVLMPEVLGTVVGACVELEAALVALGWGWCWTWTWEWGRSCPSLSLWSGSLRARGTVLFRLCFHSGWSGSSFEQGSWRKGS